MAEGTKSKAIVLGMLFRMDVANPNASWTEENVTPLKKIEAPSNQRYPYISGQAVRRYLRDTLADIVEQDEHGKPLYQFSPEEPGPDPKSPILTEGRPDWYIDDDLFGFMRAVRGETRRREAPLRVSAAFGIFPYLGDRDLGTRSSVRVTGNAEAGGALFETEVTNNVFRTTWLLELDRVGRWRGYETTGNEDTLHRFLRTPKESLTEKEKGWLAELQTLLRLVDGQPALLCNAKRPDAIEKKAWKKWMDETFPFIRKHTWSLDDAERRKRAKAILRSVKYLSGGARQSRLLVEFVPQFVIYARLTKKLPLFVNALTVATGDGQYSLVEGPILEVVKDYRADIQSLIIGSRDGFADIKRESLLKMQQESLGVSREIAQSRTCSIGEAVDLMVVDVDQMEL